jgi:hypothetical protein
MVALYTVWYNFVKQHKSLGGITPAMAAHETDRLWSIEDIVTLVENAEVQAMVAKRSAILASPQSN